MRFKFIVSILDSVDELQLLLGTTVIRDFFVTFKTVFIDTRTFTMRYKRYADGGGRSGNYCGDLKKNLRNYKTKTYKTDRTITIT